jgi:hypothetical protein
VIFFKGLDEVLKRLKLGDVFADYEILVDVVEAFPE